jgi:hypothetical protein
MAVMIQGTIKTGGAFEINTKKGEKSTLVSFVVVDEMGTSYPCQMWADDPQQPQLIQTFASGNNVRRQPVRCLVSSYSLRMRDFKDGRPSQPQINFIVSNVEIGVPAPAR